MTNRPSRKRRSISTRALLVLGLVLLLAGCASVDPAPFTQFASSLQPLRSATDAQAATSVEASRQNLVAEVAAGDVSPADLQLQISGFGARYGFGEDGEPLFARLRRFQQGLSSLNDAMIAYAQSLVVLAGGGQGGDILPTSAQFDQMARDLNANASSAAGALGVTLDPGRQALLSTAAIELFKAYIERKRREALTEAIREVQPQVEAFSDAAQVAVRFLATRVETDYAQQFLPLATVTPPDAVQILALNDTTQATLATLGSLSTNYGRLPAAHRDLAAAASKKTTGLAGLTALAEEAIRLQGLVRSLAAANAAAAGPPGS